MRYLSLICFLVGMSASALAVDVQLVGTRDLAMRAPSHLCEIAGRSVVFDPLAQVFVALESGQRMSVPTDRAWSAVGSHNDRVYALTMTGGVEAWDPTADQLQVWAVGDALDLAIALDVVWILHRDGTVSRHDPSSGASLGMWPKLWPEAARIDVSGALEQVVLAPVQGREVRLYDTSGLLLRSIEGPRSSRCADVRLGPGGVLALADRYQGEIELYGPMGEHLGQIAERGWLAGEVLRPASIAWSDFNLRVVDPALRRVSEYAIGALDAAILPIPLMVAPAAGVRLVEPELEIVVTPRFYNIAPEWIDVEVALVDGDVLRQLRVTIDGFLDTLRLTPDVTLEHGGEYRWRVQAGSAGLVSGWSAWLHFSVAGLPEYFELLPNYPNPFNAATVIPLQVPDAADRTVKVEIINILGQRVRTLVDGALEPGARSVVWDGRDDRGGEVASGTYLVRLLYKEGQIVRKAVMLK